MAIDPLTENVISLAEAAKLYPHRRRGRPTHLSCVYRHTTSGCRGIRLEFIQCGATRCTSKEAVARFFAKLTAQAAGNSAPIPASTFCQRRPEIERAERELDAAGI